MTNFEVKFDEQQNDKLRFNEQIHITIGITEETDPTVPDWAKQPSKPTYTADEVGALPNNTKIPSKPEDVGALPAGTKIPSTAEDVGAIPVPSISSVGQTIRVLAVDKNGKPIKWEAVNFPAGEAKYEKIVDNAEITANEVNFLEFTDIGDYDDFILDGMFLASGTSSGVTLFLNGIKVSSGFGVYMVDGNHTRRTVLRLILDRKRKTYICYLSLMGYKYANECYDIASKQGNIDIINEEITSFRLKLAKNIYFAYGSQFTLWGRKRDV